jgi:hypothetical protein
MGEQGKFSFIFSTVKIFIGTKIQGKERESNAKRKRERFRRSHSQTSIFSKHQHQRNLKAGRRRGHKKKAGRTQTVENLKPDRQQTR